MKYKLLLPFFIGLLYSLNVWSQDIPSAEQKNTGKQVKNEIRFNILNGIVGFPEFNYERLITDNSGIGIAGALSVNEKISGSLRSLLLPYYRLYFGKGFASGFFIEGNLALASGYIYPFNFGGTAYETKHFFGVGMALGVKLLSRNGFVGELYGGFGRLFVNRNSDFYPLYPRIGISIGKRW